MYKTVSHCRCCGDSKLVRYLDLGEQPLANSYHKNDVSLDLFPLEVMLCENCFHSQLSIVVEPSLMFKHYLYVSGTTKTFRDHCLSIAENAVSRFPGQKLSVLDIACNDGTLLGCFRNLGCEVFGVDPAENLREITKEKGIDVHVGYWGHETSQKLGRTFDIITGTNVFAHVDNIKDFLLGCRNVLNPTGLIVLEFPYCDEMVNHVEFDTVYHEHLSYFLVNSFKQVVDRCGLEIKDIIQTKIHGGSIRFFVGHQVAHLMLPPVCPLVEELIQKERDSGLLDVETYHQFSKNVAQNKEDLVALLDQLRKEGYKVIGYGAAAKGNTMLNHFKIDLDYIVDDNPMKHGYYTPGQNILIRSPEDMREETSQLAIVILSWNFFKEIKKKIEDIRGVGRDKYILYVPKVEAV